MAVSSTSGQGRVKGVPNKATAEIRALAQEYGPAAIRKLAVMAGLISRDKLLPGERPSENEIVIRAALTDLLNRGYGQPTQPVEHTLDESWETILGMVT